MTTLAQRSEDPTPPPPAYQHVPGPFWRELGAMLCRHHNFFHTPAKRLTDRLPGFEPIVADLEREPEHAGGDLLDEHLKLVDKEHQRFVVLMHAEAVLVFRVIPVTLLFSRYLPDGTAEKLHRDLSGETLTEMSLRVARYRLDAIEAQLLGWDEAARGPYPPAA